MDSFPETYNDLLQAFQVTSTLFLLKTNTAQSNIDQGYGSKVNDCQGKISWFLINFFLT